MEEMEKDFTLQEYRRRGTTIAGVVNTLEWLLIAMILAFVFRAFEMEAFRIPTGSMAETLRGVHYHIRCPRCGYVYDIGGESYMPQGRCPSCGLTLPEGTVVPICNGDRIVTLKCLYQFQKPDRWDVVVFRNPTDPQESYIKRLVGLPGEKIEIIDGDIYINDRIARKPGKVQEEFWMPVYDNDYLPAGLTVRSADNSAPEQMSGAGRWGQPFANEADSQWNMNAAGPSVFSLDSASGRVNTLVFESFKGERFRAWYSYNDSRLHHSWPVCSDLMVRYYVTASGLQGTIGVSLSKYGAVYRGYVDFLGQMVIERYIGDKKTELVRKPISPAKLNDVVLFRFANVDHQLVLEFGKNRLKYDLGPDADDAGDRKVKALPDARIFGAGKLSIRHVGIFRDIHYIDNDTERAGEGNSFVIGKDEYFMCGDNSDNSEDCRMWSKEGIGNNGRRFRMGIVPREYLVGKAFFVYWSGAFRPMENMWPVIPNLDRVCFIYGGSDQGF